MYGGPLFSDRKDGYRNLFSPSRGHIVAKDEILQQIKKKQDGVVFFPFFLSHPAFRRLATAPIVCVYVSCVCVLFPMESTQASIFRGGEGGTAKLDFH